MHNVGKTGRIFDEKHPYFNALDCTDDKPTAGLKKKCKQVRRNLMERAKTLFPLYKLYYESESGGKLYVSKWAFASNDINENIRIGKIFADNKHVIYIRPHIELDFYKNPEFKLIHEGKSLIGDAYINRLNVRNVAKYIRNGFSEKYTKNGQLQYLKKSFIVFEILKDDNIIDVARKLKGELNMHKKCEVVFLIKQNNIIQIKNTDTYDEIIKKL